MIGCNKRYMIFHNKQHPAEMDKLELETLLTSLAVERRVSIATQMQALFELLFSWEETGPVQTR